jgi:periplasmic protein TonB
MSTPRPPANDARAPWSRLPHRGAWLVAAAVATGALLFIALWLDQRSSRDFYRPGVAPPGTPGQVFEPLPVPTQDAATDSRRMVTPDPGMRPQVVEAPRPDAPPPTREPPRAASAAPSQTSAPVAIDTPAPRYPPEALRRGVSGEVLLRIEVDADGRPHAMDIVRSSGSRELDRAALVAARGWRFRPALRDGRPVAATVQVPIQFDGRR